MKFLDIINNYKIKNLILEQDVPPAPAAEVPVDPAAAAPVEEPAAPVQPDVPASIATMGQLLKKALTLPLTDEDRAKIATQIPDVTEENANEIIQQIIVLMSTYTDDIDMKVPGSDDVTSLK